MVNSIINYIQYPLPKKQYESFIYHKTIIWLGEEIHTVNCEHDILLVEHGDFISKGFELIPGLFSKTSGLVTIVQKNNVVKTISIKSGLVYEGKKFKNTAKKVYYPGELILSNINVKGLSFCEHIVGKNTDQLLVRPIEIYEFSSLTNSVLENEPNWLFNLKSKSVYAYKSGQSIKGIQNLNLISI